MMQLSFTNVTELVAFAAFAGVLVGFFFCALLCLFARRDTLIDQVQSLGDMVEGISRDWEETQKRADQSAAILVPESIVRDTIPDESAEQWGEMAEVWEAIEALDSRIGAVEGSIADGESACLSGEFTLDPAPPADHSAPSGVPPVHSEREFREESELIEMWRSGDYELVKANHDEPEPYHVPPGVIPPPDHPEHGVDTRLSKEPGHPVE